MPDDTCPYCEGTNIVHAMIRAGVDSLDKVTPCPWCEVEALRESARLAEMGQTVAESAMEHCARENALLVEAIDAARGANSRLVEALRRVTRDGPGSMPGSAEWGITRMTMAHDALCDIIGEDLCRELGVPNA